MNLLENINELGNKLNEKIDLKNIQENFLNSNIGQIVNTAIDLGLKSLLPDSIENEVIEVKDALIKGGIKECMNSVIENSIEIGKRLIGIQDIEFKSIQQAQDAVEKGKLIENVSENINQFLDKISDKNIVSENICKLIKNGKELILNNISTNIENEFNNEIKALKKIEKYIGNWEKYYSQKNIEGLTKEYNKIEKQMKKILPLENIIKNVNKIENINELIKNNKNFDFNEMYLQLAGSL